MNLSILLAMTLAVIAVPRPGAAGSLKAPKYSMEICREFPPDANTIFPASQVGSIFSQLNVRFTWLDMRECPPGRTQIVFSPENSTFDPHALALTFLSSSRIVVFMDRVKATAPPRFTPAILAYAIAHEIGHVLEASTRHSLSGVMKSSWTMDEYWIMQRPPGLTFTDEDLILLEMGLEQRATALDAPQTEPRTK